MRCPRCGVEIDHVVEVCKVLERWAVYEDGRREHLGVEAEVASEPIYMCPECGAELAREDVVRMMKA